MTKWTKKHRLQKRWQFQQVQQRGSKKRASCFLALYIRGASLQSRIGITVSKKVGTAVMRNQVKRWIREASRIEYNVLSHFWDIVIIAYPQAAQSSFEEIHTNIRSLFLFLSKKSQ